MTITAKEFEGLKPGMYPGDLEGYEEADGNFGPSIKLIWALFEKDGVTPLKKADGEQITKWQWVSQKLTPRSNLWNLLKSLGMTPVLGQEYEVDELMAPHVGRRASLMIKLVDTPTGPTDKIVDIMVEDAPASAPASKAPPAAKKAAPAAAEPAAEVCCVPKCGGVLFKYDDEGNPFCQKHAA